jgi:hypothetical protein
MPWLKIPFSEEARHAWVMGLVSSFWQRFAVLSPGRFSGLFVRVFLAGPVGSWRER